MHFLFPTLSSFSFFQFRFRLVRSLWKRFWTEWETQVGGLELQHLYLQQVNQLINSKKIPGFQEQKLKNWFWFFFFFFFFQRCKATCCGLEISAKFAQLVSASLCTITNTLCAAYRKSIFLTSKSKMKRINQNVFFFEYLQYAESTELLSLRCHISLGFKSFLFRQRITTLLKFVPIAKHYDYCNKNRSNQHRNNYHSHYNLPCVKVRARWRRSCALCSSHCRSNGVNTKKLLSITIFIPFYEVLKFFYLLCKLPPRSESDLARLATLIERSRVVEESQ